MRLTTVSDSDVSKESDALHTGLVEPFSPPPLNRVLGKADYGVKSESSTCGVLAAGVMTPSILKHGNIVYINHLNASLIHAHANVLKNPAKQHGIR